MTADERMARLEEVVYFLCRAAVDTEGSWGAWADPLHAYIDAIKAEVAEGREIEEPRHIK